MKHRDGMLDLVRGLSALAVMFGHLRAFILQDLSALPATGLATKGFYFVTSLGHQAVMVFFVLSGYFVGGSVLAALAKDRFTWSGYASARLTRLWVALVPALLLTLGFDMLGRHWNPGAYAGALRGQFSSGPTLEVPAVHDWKAFLGNLGFVQTVCVPVFGSNGPLWSLANEFWYYLLFPLAACGIYSCRKADCLSPGLPVRLGMLCVLAFLLRWLPWGLVSKGLVWFLGVVVWWVARWPRLLGLARSWSWRLGGAALFGCTLALSKSGHWYGSEYAVGVCFALWMPALLGAWPRTGWWSRLSTGMSEISYTLYVVHFPMLFFAAAVVLQGKQFAPGGQGLLWYVVLATATLTLAAGWWWLFERNTDRVRQALARGR